MTTNKDKEIAVRLVASGKNTYKDLKTALPHIPLSFWVRAGHPEKVGHNDVIRLNKQIEWLQADKYKPVDNDVLILTEQGEDLLYKLQKEERETALAVESNGLSLKAFKEAHQSKIIAVIAAVTAIISLVYNIFKG